jgi:hypothetical protein
MLNDIMNSLNIEKKMRGPIICGILFFVMSHPMFQDFMMKGVNTVVSVASSVVDVSPVSEMLVDGQSLSNVGLALNAVLFGVAVQYLC